MNVGRLRLAIPKTPRAVTYTQIPGAVRRLVIIVAVAVVACVALGFLSLRAGRWFSTEKEFFAAAQEVEARVSEVRLPKEGATTSPAKLTVLYNFAGLDRSVSGVEMAA